MISKSNCINGLKELISNVLKLNLSTKKLYLKYKLISSSIWIKENTSNLSIYYQPDVITICLQSIINIKSITKLKLCSNLPIMSLNYTKMLMLNGKGTLIC